MVNNLKLDLFSCHQIFFFTLWKITNMIKKISMRKSRKIHIRLISILFTQHWGVTGWNTFLMSILTSLHLCFHKIFMKNSWCKMIEMWKKIVKTSRNIFPERVSTHYTVCIAEAWNQVLQYNEWMMPSYVAHFTPKAAATVYISGQ